jgi:hypothetical protein
MSKGYAQASGLRAGTSPPSTCLLVMQELINCVLSLRPRYLLALKRASNESQGRSLDHGIPPEECISAFNGSQVAVQDRAELYDDEDTVKCIVRLFLNACEAFSALIAACNDQVCLPMFLCATAGQDAI